MFQLKALVLMFMISISMSAPNRGPIHSKGMHKNHLNRFVRQNTLPDIGIPPDWIEESPVDDYQNSGPVDVPLPEGIPAESEEGYNYETENGGKPTNSKPKESDLKKSLKNESTDGVQRTTADNPEEEEEEPEKGPEVDADNGMKINGRNSPKELAKKTKDLFQTNKTKGSEESMSAPTIRPKKAPKDLSKLVEICDKPVIIASANRFANSTVRLFRENSYWDLMGLPDRQAFTSDKQSLSSPMSPVRPMTSIVTVLEGNEKLKGNTFKFQKQFFWMWDEEGKQVRGGKGGEYWADIPEGGFDTMFHNGNETKPMIIGIKDNLVYYLTTKDEELEFIDPEGKIGGKFKEKYPIGITSAFTWILDDVLKVYLFRENKYCLRDVGTPKSGKDCDEWRDTAELFGCIQTEAPTPPPPKPKMKIVETEPVITTTQPTTTTTTTTQPPPKTEAAVVTQPTTTPKSSVSPLKSSTFLTILVFSAVVLKYIF